MISLCHSKLQMALEQYQPFNLLEHTHVLHTLALLHMWPFACLNRKNFMPGHITGSMWIAQPDFQRVLMIEHPHSKVWMMPGGHADDDPDILGVALRETAEETGILEAQLKLWNKGSMFDVDTHYIPPRPAKNEPEHIHFDICYLSTYASDVLPPSPENLPMKWMTLDEVEAETTPVGRRYRCVQKLRKLASE